MRGRRQVKVTEANGKVNETTVFLPNIRDVIGFLNGVWDLQPFADCFPGKNQMGDTDGSIEIFGHTLHVEFKRSRTNINAGQIVKAIRQAKHSNVTTFFIFGETNRPTEYLRFSPGLLEGTGYIKCDVMGVKKAFRQWAIWAEKNDLTSAADNDWSIARRYVTK